MKYVAIAALALLAGCAVNVDDRVKKGADFTFTTEKSPAEFSNCVRTAWSTWSMPDQLDIPNGKRLLIVGPVDVEYLIDSVREGAGPTNVKVYARVINAPTPQARIKEVHACA